VIAVSIARGNMVNDPTQPLITIADLNTVWVSEMMLTCRTYSGAEAYRMHLANLCFPDDRFEAELGALCADVLANSWYANRVNKHALIESDALTLQDAHALEIFKNEGLAPDAQQRIAKFFKAKAGR
jgi:enoyl-CoA hydratase/carnithine racemase